MKERILTILHAFVVLFIVSVIIYICANGTFENTKIDISIGTTQPDSYIMNGTKIQNESLPYGLPLTKGVAVEIETELPYSIKDDYCLAFLAMYCKTEIYVDGTLIHSYGATQPVAFGRMVGNIYVIAPLSSDMAGKQLKLVYTPYYTVTSSNFSGIIYGSAGSIKLAILKKNMPRIFIITILLTIAFIVLILLINQIFEKSGINIKLFSNFIILDLLVVVWLLCSSDLPQFLTNANEAVSFASFLSLTCMSIPYMGYCEQIFSKRKAYMFTLRIIGFCLALLVTAGFVLNLFDPMEILIITHIYMVICMGSSFVFAVLDAKNNLETIFTLVGIIMLVIASVGGFICYYSNPSSGYDGIFFGIGFVLFIVSLFLVILVRQIKLIKERQHLNTYKNLAFHDVMTNIGNRSAFEDSFATMAQRLGPNDTVTLFMFDLNRLKYTNDTYGHQAGDKMLQDMARILERVFLRYGICYRLGGDEFAVIAENLPVKPQDLTTTFDEVSGTVFINGQETLSASYGYATLPFKNDAAFRDTLFKIADNAMYESKKEYHANLK